MPVIALFLLPCPETLFFPLWKVALVQGHQPFAGFVLTSTSSTASYPSMWRSLKRSSAPIILLVTLMATDCLENNRQLPSGPYQSVPARFSGLTLLHTSPRPPCSSHTSLAPATHVHRSKHDPSGTCVLAVPPA